MELELNRRQFVNLATGTVATCLLGGIVPTVGNSGLAIKASEASLSTDSVRVYKPDPRAYQMGIDAFILKREEFVFAAFGGWDAAGAKLFGYPTFWVNRLNLPVEELGVAPDPIGRNLTDLADFVKARQ